MPTKGTSNAVACDGVSLISPQERSHPKDYHVDDTGQGCLGIISRRAQEYSNGGS